MAATITSTTSRVTIVGPHKSFTGTVSGKTVTQVGGDTLASADAERFVAWKNGTGTGGWEVRFISSATSTTLEVIDEFNGTTTGTLDFLISTNLDDIETAVAGVTKAGRQYNFNGRDWSLQNNAFLADVDRSLEMESDQTTGWSTNNGTIVCFGILRGGEKNASTITERGCSLRFNFNKKNQNILASTNSRSLTGPYIGFYGCYIDARHFWTGVHAWSFLRARGPNRYIGTTIDGPMGGRLYHEKSELVDCRFAGNELPITAWSLGATFERDIERVNFLSGNTAVKNYLGFNAVFRNVTVNLDFFTTFFLMQGDTNSTIKFVDCTNFTDSNVTDDGSGTLIQSKSINYTTSNSVGTDLSGVKVVVYDINDLEQSLETSTAAGIVPEILAVYNTYTNGAPSVNTAPFTIRLRKYDFIYQDFTSSVADPIKQQVRFSDNPVTVLSETDALAVTGVDINYTSKTISVSGSRTISEIYDYCQADLILNMAEEEFFDSIAGTSFTLDTGWSMILNAGGNLTSTSGKTLAGDLIINDSGNTVGPLEVTGDVTFNAIPSTTYTGNRFTGDVTYNVAGTYNFATADLNNVINTSGGNVTLAVDAGSTVTTNTGPNITIEFPLTELNFTNLEAGSQLVIFTAGTTTELHRVNSTGTTEQYTNSATTLNYDYTIQKAGKFPIRATNLTSTNVSTTTINSLQTTDRAYVASSGLTFGSTATLVGTEFAVTVSTTVQNWYSAWIEFFIAESTLVNTAFPIETFGSASFSLIDDHEFSSASFQYLTNDGFRYMNGTTVKAIYAAFLSQGVTAGLQAKYVQTQGGTVVAAQNTGNVNQIIKIFGDASNGNFDYRNHMVFKVQGNGYRQAEFDVINTYGTLESQLYVINLTTNVIPDITTGDPGVTGITFIDNTASPISWDAGTGGAKDYSVTIVDNNNTAGQDILEFFNYSLSLTGNFDSLPTFQYPELVLDNGADYESVRGTFRKTSGDDVVGVRVLSGNALSGIAHPDFTRFQSDDGTYGVAPVLATGSITNAISGSRVQIKNITAGTTLYNDKVFGTTYTDQYTDGTTVTAGDELNIRMAFQAGLSARLPYEINVIATTNGWSVLAEQEVDTIYDQIGLDGQYITEFEADYITPEIDIVVDADFSAHRLYNRYAYFITLSSGIDIFFKAFIAEDIANLKNDVSRVSMFLNNNTSSNLIQTDNVRLYRSDGAYPARTVTTGGGGMDVVWRNKILIAETGISGLTPAEAAQLTNIDLRSKIIPALL